MAKKDGEENVSDWKTEMKTTTIVEKKTVRATVRGRSKEIPNRSKEVPNRDGKDQKQDINKSRIQMGFSPLPDKNKSTGRQMRPTQVMVKAAQPLAASPNGCSTIFRSQMQEAPVDELCTFGDSWMQTRPSALFKEFTAVEEQISKLPNFHGFVCRDDLSVMLTKPGDWLIRYSIHPDKEKKKTKTIRETEGNEKNCKKEKCVGKSIIISVFSNEKEKSSSPKPFTPPTPIRNLIVKIADGKVSVLPEKQFKTLPDLILHYQKNTGSYKDGDFQLLKAIPLCSWEVQHDDVELSDKKLGEGAFGDVRVGKLKLKEQKETKKVEVAVKMLKNATTEVVTRDQVIELLHEARMMRILDHQNVLKTYGIAVLQEPQYLMSELCTCGALREYLKENQTTITLADKLQFALGAARGVEYLHSQKMIHRDLAVRNILLTEDKTPKVSDFGLAKQSERYEMTEQCKIPVRYLAPETLETYIFTPKTDVFSFGCVIWEIYENGQQPHDGKNAPTIKAQVRKREFLKLAATAPEEMRKLVAEKIFVADPENRCTMSTIVQTMEKIPTK